MFSVSRTFGHIRSFENENVLKIEAFLDYNYIILLYPSNVLTLNYYYGSTLIYARIFGTRRLCRNPIRQFVSREPGEIRERELRGEFDMFELIVYEPMDTKTKGTYTEIESWRGCENEKNRTLYVTPQPYSGGIQPVSDPIGVFTR